MAKYARVENGQVIEWHDSLPINWENVNGFYKLPHSVLIQLGWYPVILDEPTNFNTNKYKLGNRHATVNEDHVVEHYDLIELPTSESNKNLEAAEHAFFMQLRETRDQLLFATDWTQVADAPVDQAMWAEYRQKLRELPVECRDKYNQELKALLPAPPQLLKNIAKFY